MIQFETTRLIIRNFLIDDVNDFYEYMSLECTAQYESFDDDNFPSIRLLERLGFRREGHFIEDVTFKKDSAGNPIYVNSYSYAMLKREWTSGK